MAGRTKTAYYPFGGGLDVVTPAVTINPGRAIAMSNYEPWYEGGYRRIDGFERFDGRPKPHEQTFTGFQVTDVTGLSLGDVLTGSISGSTGVVIGIDVPTNSIAVTKVTGPGFVVNDVLTGPTPTVTIRPGANATGDTANLVTNDFQLIDEPVSAGDAVINGSVANAWAGGAPPTVTWALTDVPISVSTLNSWTLRVRARVNRVGPGTDDTATYTYRATIGAEVQTIAYTQADVGAGFVIRTANQAVSSEAEADANAATVDLEQTAFVQNGAADGLSVDTDAFEIDINYDWEATITTTPSLFAAPSQEIVDEWLVDMWTEYRNDIAVVPGADPVLGVWQRDANVYAVRDNVGGTAGILHRASSTGWTTTGITMAEYIYFNNGTDTPGPVWVEGDTVTGLVSGASATIHRIVDHAGGYSTNDAEGYLVLTGVTGGPFQNGEALQVGGTTIANAVGANVAFTFPPDGDYRFSNHNFFGGASSYRTYGVSSVGPAFEIDENHVVSPILFPNTPVGEEPEANTPYLLEEHRNHLFLAFPGGRLVHTVIGEPLTLSGFLGAAEFGLGHEITGLNSVAGGVLVIHTAKETHGLYGTNISDWEKRRLAENTGAKLDSAQTLDTVYSIDALGVNSLARSDAFGDFVGATVSQLVQPLINALQNNIETTTVVRTANQYRIYFDNGDGLIMYVPAPGAAHQVRGTSTRSQVMFGALSYPFPVRRIFNGEDENGNETTYFASDDGFVYQDRVGSNFDGTAIESSIRLAYNHIGSPSIRKRFRRVDLELNAERQIELQFTYDLSFGATDVQSGTDLITVLGGGGFWDQSNWNEFFWDSQDISTARGYLTGTGTNVSFSFYNNQVVAEAFVIQGVTIHYDVRRLQR